MNFYDEWLDAQNKIQDELRGSGFVARDKDIPWVSTPQDVRCKLMIANELGFATMGSNVLKAEIPVGWHTGKHRHGEESMHILEGEGFSIIAGQRFDWHKSSTLTNSVLGRAPALQHRRTCRCSTSPAWRSISSALSGWRGSSRSRPAARTIRR